MEACRKNYILFEEFQNERFYGAQRSTSTRPKKAVDFRGLGSSIPRHGTQRSTTESRERDCKTEAQDSHFGSRSFVFVASSVMMVSARWRGGECSDLQRRRCFFGHSAGELAAALLVGSEAPRDDVLVLAEEVQELRRVVQRLAGTIVWGRSSRAAAVAKPVVEAQPPEIAEDSDLTASVVAVSPGEAGSPGSRNGGTTSTAGVAAVAVSVAEARPLEIARNSATTELEVAVSPSERGSSGSTADGTTSAAATAAVKSAGKARPPREAKCRAATKNKDRRVFW